jgi:aminoglycoside phosphotransferase (APT) family kinase protein
LMAPIANDLSLVGLTRAIKAERRGVDVEGAVLQDSGWENAVVETRDGWIVRFPRSERVRFDREIAVLDRLQRRFPVAIPRIVWTGGEVRCAAYRKLAGATFDRATYLLAPAVARDEMAVSLADFLARMHGSLSVQELTELQVPVVEHLETLRYVADHLDEVPEPLRAAVGALAEEYAAAWAAGEVVGDDVSLHNDFHDGNMVFTAAVGRLTEIWDWSCVAVGPASFDLRYFDGLPRDLFERLGAAYEERAGRRIDLRAATVANRMENVYDALTTHSTARFALSVGWWERSDSGR